MYSNSNKTTGQGSWRLRMEKRYEYLRQQKREDPDYSEKNFTKLELAEVLGVDQSTVVHWFTGRRTPKSLDLYQGVADYLEMDVCELVFGRKSYSERYQEVMFYLQFVDDAHIQAVTNLIKDLAKSTRPVNDPKFLSCHPRLNRRHEPSELGRREEHSLGGRRDDRQKPPGRRSTKDPENGLT